MSFAHPLIRPLEINSQAYSITKKVIDFKRLTLKSNEHIAKANVTAHNDSTNTKYMPKALSYDNL